jgi:hypothetical protein
MVASPSQPPSYRSGSQVLAVRPTREFDVRQVLNRAREKKLQLNFLNGTNDAGSPARDLPTHAFV